jgi:hypothetical protein
MLHPDTLHELAQSRTSEWQHEADMARLAGENQPTGESRRAHYTRTVAIGLVLLTALAVWLG